MTLRMRRWRKVLILKIGWRVSSQNTTRLYFISVCFCFVLVFFPWAPEIIRDNDRWLIALLSAHPPALVFNRRGFDLHTAASYRDTMTLILLLSFKALMLPCVERPSLNLICFSLLTDTYLQSNNIWKYVRIWPLFAISSKR